MAVAIALSAACGSTSDPAGQPPVPAVAFEVPEARSDAAPAPPTTQPTAAGTTGLPPADWSPLARQVEPLASALYDPADHVPAVAPISLTIDGIDVVDAPVIGVGVDESGELDVPPADEVGWYRFGPSPGDDGSAVLAAHIAYNGEDGVFRHLERLEPGALVEVGYADGSSSAFLVVALAQYDKFELPFDVIFSGEGQPLLTMITCGGDFNPAVRSYDDNVVAYAVPVS